MGRPAKVRPPPRSGQASGGSLGLIQANDLAELKQAKDLAGSPQSKWPPYLTGTDFAAAAGELNEAFEWFALFATGQHRRAPHTEVRDWFKQVAGQATDLLHALGHDRPPLDAHGFQDVVTLLIVAKPHPDAGPERERHAQHRMERLARRAMPDAYSQVEREGATNPGWEVANHCINERLKATLELLQLLATHGARHHSALVKWGGREREEARQHLMVILAGQYERLFGRLPAAPSPTMPAAEQAAWGGRETIPKGPALAWFRALLDLIGTRAAEALTHAQPGGAAPDPNRVAMLRELVDLATAARKGKAADGLAHWIRKAAAIQARHPPPVEIAPDPHFTPDPLEELVG